ncbi:ribosomal protein S30Ae/sigma 54 modulation protein [Baffinella frigidus]|nr:ribosomal protein S30Ae/sigma 54 modulation protein [Cryptophyta sp. CCMP2293]
MASRFAALAAMSLSLGSVSCFVVPIGAPLSLRTAGSALGSCLHPASARLAAPAPFAPLQRSLASHSTFKMAAAAGVPIIITGVNIELTPAIKTYVTDKVGNALSKVGRRVTRCEATLTVNKNPSIEKPAQIEIVYTVKGNVMRSSETTHDMYASIDKVVDSMRRKLRNYKERIIDAHRQSKPLAADFDDAEIEDFKLSVGESLGPAPTVPAVDMTVVKKKTFPMEPISVEDAVLCLEYIEHDFYVFKNAESGKVNVVYKRGSGGVGLIEPEK